MRCASGAEVTFNIDANCILNVTAKVLREPATSLSKNSGTASKEDIEAQRSRTSRGRRQEARNQNDTNQLENYLSGKENAGRIMIRFLIDDVKIEKGRRAEKRFR